MPPTKAEIRHHTFDGTGRQPCRVAPCPFQSVAGLHKGQGHCPYHWAILQWGKAWADRALPGYTEAAQRRRRQP